MSLFEWIRLSIVWLSKVYFCPLSVIKSCIKHSVSHVWWKYLISTQLQFLNRVYNFPTNGLSRKNGEFTRSISNLFNFFEMLCSAPKSLFEIILNFFDTFYRSIRNQISFVYVVHKLWRLQSILHCGTFLNITIKILCWINGKNGFAQLKFITTFDNEVYNMISVLRVIGLIFLFN